MKWKLQRVEYYVNKCNGPPIIFLLGNALECIYSPKVLIKRVFDYAKQYESPLRGWLFHIPYVGIYTPEDIQMLTTKCLEKDSVFDFLGELIGDGVLTTKVAKWRRSRRIMNSAFNMTVMSKPFLEVFNRQSLVLIDQLKAEVNSKEYFDLWPYIFKSTFSNIIETAMGHTHGINEDDFTKMRKSYEVASEMICKRVYRPWLRPPFVFKLYLFLMGKKNVLNEFKQLPLKILEARRQMFTERKLLESSSEGKAEEKNDKSYKNVIDILLNQAEAEDQFTNQEIADEVTTILFAGSETNAITISFTLFMLAIRQDIQEKVYNELSEVFGEDDRLPTMEDLNQLVYLEQCIKETLRFVTVAPLSSRVSSEDITLSSGHLIPAGVSIVAAYVLMHRDEKYYSNPSQWNPANFDADKVASRPAGAFVPFGYGPRKCLGYKYAYLAIKTLLSTLLRNYKFSTDFREEDVELTIDILLRSATPYRVKVECRHKTSLFS
ncbi:hypothetical protein V9T40_005467 [Parthenolecanium corni]|uniref:Cytochrome P450 n=1 Tax=Parthenolecanium corni TaxID=536013 RepID=A0AAN9TJA0_9HEMI